MAYPEPEKNQTGHATFSFDLLTQEWFKNPLLKPVARQIINTTRIRYQLNPLEYDESQINDKLRDLSEQQTTLQTRSWNKNNLLFRLMTTTEESQIPPELQEMVFREFMINTFISLNVLTLYQNDHRILSDMRKYGIENIRENNYSSLQPHTQEFVSQWQINKGELITTIRKIRETAQLSHMQETYDPMDGPTQPLRPLNPFQNYLCLNRTMISAK